jgi:hypothetical protein
MKAFIAGFFLGLTLYSPSASGNQPQREIKPVEIVLKPAGSSLMTETIQKAIDKCSDEGGGVVRFSAGTYSTGTLLLKDNITLYLDQGALLLGSDKYEDYRNDAFFSGRDISGISIIGRGIIDGVDCYNPKGEEGFRGPHCIRLINCRNIRLDGITIRNSANWAINCRNCSDGYISNVTIRGGHDGLHTRFCNNFTVRDCDFRTGDDAFAGNDNRDFYISDCLINSSCNGFRLGCLNLTVERCKIWGPGEYVHKIQKRNNMLSAFVHFSPKDENPELKSGNWILRDITVENVDILYIYNFRNGLWQTGQPVTSVNFENIIAEGLLKAFYVSGDNGLLLDIGIRNSSFSFREEATIPSDRFEGAQLQSTSFFYADNFNRIYFEKVAFIKDDPSILINCESGNNLVMKKMKFNTGYDQLPCRFEKINNIELKNLKTIGSQQARKIN